MKKKPKVYKLILKWLSIFILTIIGGAFCFWCCLAIYFSNLPWDWLRTAIAWAFPAIVVATVYFFRKSFFKVLLSVSILYLIIVSWYLLIPASNDKDWLPEYQRTAYATIKGDLIIVHNIRNFDYLTEHDFKVRYYDKTFNLNELKKVDFMTVYWDGNVGVAHTMLSFNFADKDFLCFSVETRRAKGEPQGAVRGLFKQYGLIYVVGDERDLIRLRTNYRKEDVYLFPTTSSPEEVRVLFMDLIKRINKLHEDPEFYNTLTQNCTTALVPSVEKVRPPRPFDIRLLMNGYIGEMAYENGWIKPVYKPFSKMREKCYINPLVENDPDPHNYSLKIRQMK